MWVDFVLGLLALLGSWGFFAGGWFWLWLDRVIA
jgi:hypothetical protein